jgi:hypothetical protein
MARKESPTTRVSRRKYLAGGVAAVTAAVAGCTEGTVNWLADKILEEVNVLNQTETTVSGTVQVVGPGGETRLDDEFTIEGDNGNDATYDDIWTETGVYEASVELEDHINGTESASDSVEITNTEDERLFVLLGSPAEYEEDIVFLVGEKMTDVVPEDET